MFKHVLIATDGSELSRAATAAGINLARDMKARVTLLHCSMPYEVLSREPLTGMSRERYEAVCQSGARDAMEPASQLAREAGVDAHATTVFAYPVWRSIIETAAQRGCDMIVMGSHGRGGIASALLGSESLKVLGHSALPVLIVRSGAA